MKLKKSSRKNNSKRAYQLVKNLTTVKQGEATTVQDRSEKCLTKERQILNRLTEYCSELYNHKTNGDPPVYACAQSRSSVDFFEGRADQPGFYGPNGVNP